MDLLELEVGEAAQGGWCVAREPSGRVVLVRHALPGERVLAQVTEVTARFARADAVQVLAASPDRVGPPCPHARPGGCGGCDWQHASPAAQRRLKGAVISQQLRRIAGLDREVTVEACRVTRTGWAGAPGSGSRSARTAPPGCASTGPMRSSTSGTARSRTRWSIRPG